MPRGQLPREGVVPRKRRLQLSSPLTNSKRLMQFGPASRPLTDTNTWRPSKDVTIAAAAHCPSQHRCYGFVKQVTEWQQQRVAKSTWQGAPALCKTGAAAAASS